MADSSYTLTTGGKMLKRNHSKKLVFMEQKRNYPIGLQNFSEIIEKKGVYIDKTEYVYKMAHSMSKHFFLSRPRRFGKSLFVSTLEAYFLGRKKLFEGLAINNLEKEWTPYPVIHLDMSNGKYFDINIAKSNIDEILNKQELDWRITIDENERYNFGKRLTNIIQKASYQNKVVVLIDEYDTPILDTIGHPELQEEVRKLVRNLFSPLKSQSDYLRFVFLTGISQFSQLSVFSELNNLNILTFNPEYEACCGITQNELVTQMKPDIEYLAERLSKHPHDITFDKMVEQLKSMYDGYHFSERMTADIYNPWSLMNAFEQGCLHRFWSSTGNSASLIKLIGNIDLKNLESFEASMSSINAPFEQITNPVPVLFQSGYLTIKKYNTQEGRYTLGFPNEEVREGFADSLCSVFLEDNLNERNLMFNAYNKLKGNKKSIEEFLDELRNFYAAIPYSITNKNERHYQAILYALLVAIGADVQVEVETAAGRIDMVLKKTDAIFIIEYKYNQSAEAALQQIKEKYYGVAFHADTRLVFGIGLNINGNSRTIDSRKIEEVPTTLPNITTIPTDIDTSPLSAINTI